MSKLVARHLIRLHHDRSGQSIVLIVFVLALLVAFSSAVINTGAHVAARQQMQTSADAAAYSGAAVKAKAMNIIALTNLTMATLMGFQVVAKFVKYGVIVVAGILAGLCFWAVVPACMALGPVEAFQQATQPFIDGFIKLLDIAMRVMEVLATVVALLAPVWALVTVHRVAKLNGADVGLGLFTHFWLPTKKVSKSYLCDRVKEAAYDMVKDLKYIGGIPFLGNMLASAVSGIAGVLCGGAGSYTFEPQTDAEGSQSCTTCRNHDDLSGTTWQRVGGTCTEDVQVRNNGAWAIGSHTVSDLEPGPWLKVTGDLSSNMFAQSGADCATPVARTTESYADLPGTPPRRLRTTNEEEYAFRGCVWPSKPVTLGGDKIGGETGACPGPHPRLLGHHGDDCNGGPVGQDELRNDHWLEVAAAASLRAEPGPMAGLLGERDSRTLITFAQAEFYSAAGDLWHTDWRARLTPIRAGSLAQLAGLAAAAIQTLSQETGQALPVDSTDVDLALAGAGAANH